MALASANGRQLSYNNNPPDLKFQLNYLQSYQVHVTKINLQNSEFQNNKLYLLYIQLIERKANP